MERIDMGSSLLSNITNEEYTNENCLTGRNSVHVVVEDNDDVRFWNDFLCWVAPHTTFEISPYQQNKDGEYTNLNTGKARLLANPYDYGEYYWACVDSDYDYLLGEKSTYHTALSSPYIFQTKIYSIENYNCYPPTLNDVCRYCTCLTNQYDFSSFCNRLSGILHPLLVWSLYLQSINDTGSFKLTEDWKNVLPCPNNQVLFKKNEDELLDCVRDKVQNKIAKLQKLFPNYTDKVNDYASQLNQKYGVTPKTAIWYVRGHDLFDYIFEVLVKPVCDKWSNKEINLIKTLSGKSYNDRIAAYRNSTRDAKSALKDNFRYKNCHDCHPLVTDIKDKVLAALAK